MESFTLRPYQVKGAAWLASRHFAILGDATGLGKTPQAITACLTVRQRDPRARILYIAPASTLPGLVREWATWAPAESVAVLSARPGSKPMPPVAGPCVCLVAWSSLHPRRKELAAGADWTVVIMDEAHKAKTPTAKQTKAALGYWGTKAGQWVRHPGLLHGARHRWALTATPVPNRPIELQPLLHLAGGYAWASRSAYGDAYCRRKNEWAPLGYDYNGACRLEELHRRLAAAGCILRRTPEDVPGELPTLTTTVCPLAGVREPVSGRGLDPDALVAVLDGAAPGPLGIRMEEWSAYRAEMGVAKIPAVRAWVEDWLEGRDALRLVLFCWHREVAAGLACALELYAPLVATGDQTPEERQRRVDAFATPGGPRLFIATIAACGTGLNGLHKATTHCAFAEASCVPGDLVQAIGRVRRFASIHDHTTATILTGADSLEDHVLRMIARKLKHAATILGDTPCPASPS